MGNPVDLTNLREMTDGDHDLEMELFEEFYRSATQCIVNMENNCTDGENEDWRAAAHALKGTAYNLGAEPLGGLCKVAQEKFAASGAEKQEMLSGIKAEYAEVEKYLRSI